MDTVLERQTIKSAAEQQAQLQHNAMIAERYRRLQNAEASQFGEHTEEMRNESNYTVRASVLAPEAPVMNTPVMNAPVVDAPMQEQVPQITQYVRTPVENPVFTTEKFDVVSENSAVAQEVAVASVAQAAIAPAPVSVYTATAAVASEAQYSLSRAAKMVLAAFVAIVMVMITLICVNTQIIQRKSVELDHLQMRRDELIEENQELQLRIQGARSEESIREYVEEQNGN